MRCPHRRRINTEEKAKVVAVGWEDVVQYLNVALTIYSSKDDLKKSFWENIQFRRVVVWTGVNWMIIHFPKHPSAKKSLFYSSFYSNQPSEK